MESGHETTERVWNPCPHHRSGVGLGVRFDGQDPGDRRVRRRLRDHGEGETAIFNDSTLKVNEINVETFKGVVQLSGFVNSQADINKAVQVARGVAGVKSVKNDMRIK